MDWRRVVGGIGRTLIAAGTLILLFVAYQLWGTGIAEARSQHDLKKSFQQLVPSTTVTTAGGQPGPSTSTTVPVGPPPPPTGAAVAIIRIPRIGVDKAVVQGVALSDLKKGPGHYPTTPMPGQAGNAAIAGHRTTYGAPFSRIDELVPGDQITVTTLHGTWTYVVVGAAQDPSSGHFVVKPQDVWVLDDFGDNRLTLTACHPKFSADQRIVVVAKLVEAPAAPPTTTTTPAAAATSQASGASGLAAGGSSGATVGNDSGATV
ncbi:MAG TPA: class E sortase, partial [Acidimicrobiales bacterium]|nr:class E sortase [Acidimicrobiales bacterium]